MSAEANRLTRPLPETCPRCDGVAVLYRTRQGWLCGACAEDESGLPSHSGFDHDDLDEGGLFGA